MYAIVFNNNTLFLFQCVVTKFESFYLIDLFSQMIFTIERTPMGTISFRLKMKSMILKDLFSYEIQ